MNACKEHVTNTERLVAEHSRPMVRAALITAGTLCVGLGILGAFLPVLPTTPFLLLAAACYARSSRRFYRRLLASRMFGPLIDEWRRHRAIPYRTKVSAIVLMGATLGVSIALVRPWWLQCLLGLLGVVLAVFLYRIPSRRIAERPA
jgi:uncharacterized protein